MSIRFIKWHLQVSPTTFDPTQSLTAALQAIEAATDCTTETDDDEDDLLALLPLTGKLVIEAVATEEGSMDRPAAHIFQNYYISGN